MSSWVIETLIATTLLMAAVLALRDLVTAKFGPRVAYLLWLAPALRMALPPLPASWFGAVKAPVQSVMVVLEGASSLSFQPTIAVESGTPIPWAQIAMAIWLGGAALFFAWHTARYLRFARTVMAGAEPLFDHDAIRIATSAAVSSPLAFGIFGKAVLVPSDFEHRFSDVEQRLAIAHEVTHHVRRDLPVNLAALAMLALHWFNPIAHIAHRAFRLDQEAACDAIVLDGASAEERHAYGSALFKSATGAVPFAVCAMGTTTQLKARLRRIVKARSQAGGVRTGMMIAGLLVVAGLVTTASGGVAAEAVATIEKTSTAITVNDSEPANIRIVAQQTERAAVAAEETANRADEAAHKAWAESEPAQADVARAKADFLRARADALHAEAEIFRAQADTRYGLAIAGVEPPSPPVPPAPPAPPAIAQVRAKAKCADEDHMQTIENRDQNFIICIKNAEIQATIREALIDARNDIRSDIDDIEEPGVRSRLMNAVAAIDRQIERMDLRVHRAEMQ